MGFLNKIKKVIEVNDKSYYPYIYLNAWNNWTIAYKSLNNEYFCSVCVEPDNEPVYIEDTIGCAINSGCGNAKTPEDAIDMINKYFEIKKIN
jgi:hypothetical protein